MRRTTPPTKSQLLQRRVGMDALRRVMTGDADGVSTYLDYHAPWTPGMVDYDYRSDHVKQMAELERQLRED